MEQSSTIEIHFDDLAVLKNGDHRRVPLSELDTNSHIHGRLQIKINGRVVPQMGYFGENDVCFSQWVTELKNIRRKFRGSVQAKYVFDEGEQGQPAFVFERDGDSMYLSIEESVISGGEAHPDWQKVEFKYKEFVAEYDKFYKDFMAELQSYAPQIATQWRDIFITD